jgi:hypothetical protein
MKTFLLIAIMSLGLNALGAVDVANVRVAKGVMPNPVLAPMGQLVNTDNGEVLYVNSIISVLAPSQLKVDCIYQVHFTRDVTIKSRVRLVPPMKTVSCGHDFGNDK